MDRTIILQLQPNSEQAKILQQSLQQSLQEHTDCFNVVAHEGFTASRQKAPAFSAWG
ncbi:MAG TPA: hypothetical protein VHZ51_20035 [Ktedonobacteraceae bacterium]|jgi:hypothetical protein|nr:hypothetical protein [Ktedonobacteraceae bacterium]